MCLFTRQATGVLLGVRSAHGCLQEIKPKLVLADVIQRAAPFAYQGCACTLPVALQSPAPRHSIVGLLLAKELVLVDPDEGLVVGQLPTRVLPRLSAATPLYDMLKLFEAGGSHIALLTRPAASGVRGSGNGSHALSTAGSGGGLGARSRSRVLVSGAAAYVLDAGAAAGAQTSSGGGAGDGDGTGAWAPPGGWGDAREGEAVGIITIEDAIEEVGGATR